MATSDPLQIISLMVSGNNLSAVDDDYLFVKCAATEGYVVPCSSVDVPLGINLDIGRHGIPVRVVVEGIAKSRLAGTVKAGNLMKAYDGTNDGRAVFTVNLSAHGAMALEDGSSGEIITSIITRGIGS